MAAKNRQPKVDPPLQALPQTATTASGRPLADNGHNSSSQANGNPTTKKQETAANAAALDDIELRPLKEGEIAAAAATVNAPKPLPPTISVNESRYINTHMLIWVGVDIRLRRHVTTASSYFPPRFIINQGSGQLRDSNVLILVLQVVCTHPSEKMGP